MPRRFDSECLNRISEAGLRVAVAAGVAGVAGWGRGFHPRPPQRLEMHALPAPLFCNSPDPAGWEGYARGHSEELYPNSRCWLFLWALALLDIDMSRFTCTGGIMVCGLGLGRSDNYQ